MSRDISLYIEDILNCIEKIKEYTEGIKEKDFYENTKLQDAVTRRIEIIGEAVKGIPESFRKKHPNIPWKSIAGMHDLVIHSYFGVNKVRVWKVVVEDIPKLKTDMKKIEKDISDKD